jgi:hypothetical protein
MPTTPRSSVTGPCSLYTGTCAASLALLTCGKDFCMPHVAVFFTSSTMVPVLQSLNKVLWRRDGLVKTQLSMVSAVGAVV